MKLLIMIPVIMLASCMSVPVTQNFPKAPDALMIEPPELKEVASGATASTVFETVIENYGTYYEVANRLKAWQKWYQEQKKIFDKLGN